MPEGPRYVTAKDLAALPVEVLARILAEFCLYDDALAARCRVALAQRQGAQAQVDLVSAQLAILASDTRYWEWRDADAYVKQWEAIHAAIVDEVLPQAPQEAADLLQRMMESAGHAYEHVHDDGDLGMLFDEVLKDWGRAWAAVEPRDRLGLARMVQERLNGGKSDYGQYRGIVRAFGLALGHEGLAELERLLRQEPAGATPSATGHPDIRHALVDIAGAQQDPDALARVVEDTRTTVERGLEVAQRYLGANEPAKALAWLDRVPSGSWGAEELRLQVLERLGRPDEIQRLRWTRFTRSLSIEDFRAYAAGEPPDALDAVRSRGVTTALESGRLAAALGFLVDLPDLDTAELLVMAHRDQWGREFYSTVERAAHALEDVSPLAATVLYRATAEDVLDRKKSKAYHHAVDAVRRVIVLAPRVQRWRGVEEHEQFMARIRDTHRAKYGFWGQMGMKP